MMLSKRIAETLAKAKANHQHKVVTLEVKQLEEWLALAEKYEQFYTNIARIIHEANIRRINTAWNLTHQAMNSFFKRQDREVYDIEPSQPKAHGPTCTDPEPFRTWKPANFTIDNS